MFNLSNSPEGKLLKIASFSGGYMSQKRLYDLGILKNEKIKIIKNDGFGPIIIKVKGANIAIGRGLSRKILVEESNE